MPHDAVKACNPLSSFSLARSRIDREPSALAPLAFDVMVSLQSLQPFYSSIHRATSLPSSTFAALVPVDSLWQHAYGSYDLHHYCHCWSL